MSTAIWWVRRDLRLADNQALRAAMAQSESVVPVFILDPRLLASPYSSTQRNAFLLAGLRSLDQDLRQLGSRLIIHQGDPVEALTILRSQSGATAVYAEEDISPYARRRDARVQAALPLILTNGLTVHPPDLLLKKDGCPYTVYTPFSKTWKSLPRPVEANLLSKPTALNTPKGLPTLPLSFGPALSDQIPFKPGEAEALRRLEKFVRSTDLAIYQYGEQRNRPDIDGTSALSPYIRFGMLSLRRAVVAASQAIEEAPDKMSHKSAETWLNELIWREFYLTILYHFPHVRQRSFRSQYDGINWDNDTQAFEAWCQGRTGYPIVDAAMRQLQQSGWMHNRTRMITASFLVKDLLIDWRWGERWFIQHLIDGDPASNNGGWQWTAGTGTDAAPYFRIFNPVLQSKKFDPQGKYIRRWLPELSDVPDRYIHEPWRMPADIQIQTNCRIGQDYPRPIVDHASARKRTLAAYKLVSG
ncbi:MAG: deoxyribodipyrimidine photo-lyase [Chloroflexi bacterium]|nr:deoxyribodipyrimidine photo-lyase [Chloroflexota bacterium]